MAVVAVVAVVAVAAVAAVAAVVAVVEQYISRGMMRMRKCAVLNL